MKNKNNPKTVTLRVDVDTLPASYGLFKGTHHPVVVAMRNGPVVKPLTGGYAFLFWDEVVENPDDFDNIQEGGVPNE